VRSSSHIGARVAGGYLAVKHSMAIGVPVPETPLIERLFGALAGRAFLLVLVWFRMFFAL